MYLKWPANMGGELKTFFFSAQLPSDMTTKGSQGKKERVNVDSLTIHARKFWLDIKTQNLGRMTSVLSMQVKALLEMRYVQCIIQGYPI